MEEDWDSLVRKLNRKQEIERTDGLPKSEVRLSLKRPEFIKRRKSS
jgi:hypothetical protein